MPRAIALANRFPGNVRLDLLEALLEEIRASLATHLADPVRIDAIQYYRTVTFMGALRFATQTHTREVSVSRLDMPDGKPVFVGEKDPVGIDLPAKLDGFWLDAFLAPWQGRIAACLVDHSATGSALSWWASLKLELARSLRRSVNWYRLRCTLRDALQLDPQVLLWCRKGRPTHRNYVTHRQYNQVLNHRSTYERIEKDNPNLVWLYNLMVANERCTNPRQPVAGMKEWLVGEGGVSEAGWRMLANGKEQHFRHLIDFTDGEGSVSGSYDYLPDWLQLLGRLRRKRPVPRPLTGLFEHDGYRGWRTLAGDRVRFRNVTMQPGVLCAILAEGERRLANGSHRSYIEEDLVEILAWLDAESPVFDKNQLRQGWKYLARCAVAWKVECEEYGTLSFLRWDSLLPEVEVGPWRIVPLTDAWQLRREALAQRHCVDQSQDDCLAGTRRIFSIRDGRNRPVATLGIELDGCRWKVFGFLAFANLPVPDNLRGLECKVLQRYQQLWDLSRAGLSIL